MVAGVTGLEVLAESRLGGPGGSCVALMPGLHPLLQGGSSGFRFDALEIVEVFGLGLDPGELDRREVGLEVRLLPFLGDHQQAPELLLLGLDAVEDLADANLESGARRLRPGHRVAQPLDEVGEALERCGGLGAGLAGQGQKVTHQIAGGPPRRHLRELPVDQVLAHLLDRRLRVAEALPKVDDLAGQSVAEVAAVVEKRQHRRRRAPLRGPGASTGADRAMGARASRPAMARPGRLRWTARVWPLTLIRLDYSERFLSSSPKIGWPPCARSPAGARES